MRKKWRVGAIIGGIAMLPASGARAAEPSLDLRWQAPPECPSREAVLESMQSMLGPSWSKLASLHATGVIERRSSGFVLRLSIDDGKGGQRDVPAQSCEKLGDVAALALVLLFTSNGTLDADSTRAAPLGDQPKPPVVDRSGDPPSPDEHSNDPIVVVEPTPPRVGERLHWIADAPLFGVGIGPLPKPHPALGLGLGVERGGISLRVIGQWGLSQQIPADTAGYGAELQRASLGLWACAEVTRWPLSVSPCLQASLTYVFGSGYGPLLRSASQSETSGAVGAGVLGRWRIRDNLALMLGAGAQLELSRPVLLLKPLGTFQRLAPFSATLLLGPEWIF